MNSFELFFVIFCNFHIIFFIYKLDKTNRFLTVNISIFNFFCVKIWYNTSFLFIWFYWFHFLRKLLSIWVWLSTENRTYHNALYFFYICLIVNIPLILWYSLHIISYENFLIQYHLPCNSAINRNLNFMSVS